MIARDITTFNIVTQSAFTAFSYDNVTAIDSLVAASVSSSGNILVWDSPTWELLTTLTQPDCDIMDMVAYTTDGVDYLAAGGCDNLLYIWTADTDWTLVTAAQRGQPIMAVDVMLPESFIFTGYPDGTIHHYKTEEYYFVADGAAVTLNPEIQGLKVSSGAVDVWSSVNGTVQGRTLTAGAWPVTHFMAVTESGIAEIAVDTYYLFAPCYDKNLYIYELP